MIQYYLTRIKLGRMKLKHVPEKYRDEVGRLLDSPCEEIVEEIKEPIVEEIEEVIIEESVPLTIEDIEDVVNKFGFKVSPTVNYIAVKSGRLNAAKISNDMKSITLKNGDTIAVNTKKDLENVIKTL